MCMLVVGKASGGAAHNRTWW